MTVAPAMLEAQNASVCGWLGKCYIHMYLQVEESQYGRLSARGGHIFEVQSAYSKISPLPVWTVYAAEKGGGGGFFSGGYSIFLFRRK